MKEYIVTLIAVSILCGVISVLSPEGVGGGIKKHMNLLLSLCVLSIIMAPVGNLLKKGDGFELDLFGDFIDSENAEQKYDEIYKNTLGGYTAESVSAGSKNMLCKAFDIDGDDVDVCVVLGDNEEELTVEKVHLIIYSGAVVKDPRTMSEYLTGLFNCECEIIYG